MKDLMEPCPHIGLSLEESHGEHETCAACENGWVLTEEGKRLARLMRQYTKDYYEE